MDKNHKAPWANLKEMATIDKKKKAFEKASGVITGRLIQQLQSPGDY